MKWVAALLLMGCAHQKLALEANDSYCTPRHGGDELCVEGVRRGLDGALRQALDGSVDARLSVVDVSVRERDGEAGQIEVTYRVEVRGVTAREETLTRPYDDGRAPMREAVLRLLVDVVSRVTGMVAKANAPVSL
jgi:hypothetical protein